MTGLHIKKREKKKTHDQFTQRVMFHKKAMSDLAMQLVITTLTDKRTACELKAEIVRMLPVMTDQTLLICI